MRKAQISVEATAAISFSLLVFAAFSAQAMDLRLRSAEQISALDTDHECQKITAILSATLSAGDGTKTEFDTVYDLDLIPGRMIFDKKMEDLCTVNEALVRQNQTIPRGQVHVENEDGSLSIH